MNKLQAHFKKMQAAAASYLEPRPVDPGQLTEDPDGAFISQMIYMLDGPEQRAAEAELDREREDLKLMVKSLMRDLRVVDHILTLEEPDGKRVIVASNLIT
jgi:hypothetical protein